MKQKKVYVVGNNVSKSLSPTIFNYWLKKYNIRGLYEYKEIKKNTELDKLIKNIRDDSLLGLNITIPYKEKAFRFLNKYDIHSKKIGAINFINVIFSFLRASFSCFSSTTSVGKSTQITASIIPLMSLANFSIP